jgi:hypothetical protein
MIGKWLKHILGINELENRLTNIENEKVDLESRIVEAENEKALVSSAIEQSVSSSELVSEAQNFLGQLNIKITKDSSAAALSALRAVDAVIRYDLKRYVPPIEKGYPSAVITIEELQKHPEEYLHKLDKGFLNFPVGLDFKGINSIFHNIFANIDITPESPYSNNGTFDFVLSSLLGNSGRGSRAANALMVQACQLSHLKRDNCDSWVQMDTLDFFSNYNGIVGFIAELPEVSAEAKKKAIGAMEFARFAYMTAIEIVGTARIRDLPDLLKYDQDEEAHSVTGEIKGFEPAEQLKMKLKSSFLSEPKGTTYHDIDELLPIRSRERFVKLASEITAKIMADDKKRKGLTYEINKPLEKYSVGEALVLASYFARNVITQYKKLEDRIEEIFAGKSSDAVSGKCTDYTGLALQYLREYLIPMQPDKFRNWKFGVAKDHIGDYNHCYMQALHINPDLSADVYFLDPTRLAKKGIKELKSPKHVIKGLDSKKLPLMIQREAEDLLYAANERMEGK